MFYVEKTDTYLLIKLLSRFELQGDNHFGFSDVTNRNKFPPSKGERESKTGRKI